MSIKLRHGGQVSDSVGLLVSILVRYPEVGTINVDEVEQLLTLTFYLAEDLSEHLPCHEHLTESLMLFNQLEGRKCRVCSLCLSRDEVVTTLEIVRDIETVTLSELNLLVNLMRQSYYEQLVTDVVDEIPEEEQLIQDEIIKHMLDIVRTKKLDKSVLALREEGRVLVFNK